MASDILEHATGKKPPISAAQRYVALAEDAISLMSLIDDPEQRVAVCRISEAWLELAEAELR